MSSEEASGGGERGKVNCAGASFAFGLAERLPRLWHRGDGSRSATAIKRGAVSKATDGVRVSSHQDPTSRDNPTVRSSRPRWARPRSCPRSILLTRVATRRLPGPAASFRAPVPSPSSHARATCPGATVGEVATGVPLTCCCARTSKSFYNASARPLAKASLACLARVLAEALVEGLRRPGTTAGEERYPDCHLTDMRELDGAGVGDEHRVQHHRVAPGHRHDGRVVLLAPRD